MIYPTLNIDSDGNTSVVIIDDYPEIPNTIKLTTSNCIDLFLPLLQAFLCQYNEGYVEGYEDGVDDILGED